MTRSHPPTDRIERRPGTQRPALFWLLAGAALLLSPLGAQAAGESDIALFSSSSGAPPNIMLLLDDSGSMADEPGWCTGSGYGGGGLGGRRGGGGGGTCGNDGNGGFGRFGRGGGWRRGGGGTCTEPDPTLDCRPKWEIMRDAAINMVETLNPPDGAGGYAENARFGIFMFDDDHNGGMLIVPIADDNTADVIDALQNDIHPNGSTPLGGSLVDIGRYFAGPQGWGSGLTALPLFGSLPYAASAPEPTHEQNVGTPMDLACRDSFVIALSDGEGQPTDGAKYPNLNLWTTLGDADGDGAETVGTDGEWFDDAAYAMARRDFQAGISGVQNVRTHTIAFDVTGAGADLLEKAAEYGEGTFHEANSDLDLSAAFLSATANIFASLGSFTGATVSSSRSREGDLFINSWFEPSDKPVWAGHLEAYRVAPDGEIQSLDSSSGTPTYVPALDSTTNKLIAPPLWDAADKLANDTSRRIITAASDYSSTPIDVTPANISDAEMGLTVDLIPGYPNVGALGITTTDQLRTALIDYLRGKDAFDQNGDGSTTDMRSPVLGDIFHSTPVMIGGPSGLHMHEPGYASFYNTYQHRNRVVYAGSNAGLLEAFDAGEWKTGDDPLTTDLTENGYYSFGTGTNGVNGGSELFGYVPRRLLDELSLMPLNSPRVQYYVDGSPTAADAWLGDKAGGTPKVKDPDEWKTVLVTGLRNGGRGYVALDVTDPSSASYPGVLWEFTDDTLGDSWSKPVITRVRMRAPAGYGDHCGADDGDGDCREQWVAIFGGGYKSNADPNDADFGPDTSSTNWTYRSKAIFVVALDTGQLLAKVAYDATGTNGPDQMLYALPGSPAVLDLDFDGFADVVYIGDLGGQMWKWDLHQPGDASSGLVSNWPAGIFFKTPPTNMGSGVYHYRSFFESPAASYVRGSLHLAFGSGERESLFYGGAAGYDENNRFYVIRDPAPTGTGAFDTVHTESDSDITDVTDGSNLPGNGGYYITLPDGEKFVADPTVFAGFVIASSFQPEAGSDVCVTATGQAKLYVFDIATGVGYFDDGTSDVAADRYLLVGGGLPSKPKVSTGEDPSDDVIYIKTSTGQILLIDPPPRPSTPVGLIYWRQVF